MNKIEIKYLLLILFVVDGNIIDDDIIKINDH